jgi:hypothetical protein
MRISLEPRQFNALHKLRGLPARAHMLLMTSGPEALEGSREAFDELVEFIGEELGEGMLSSANAKALYSLCLGIDPDCADWLGM